MVAFHRGFVQSLLVALCVLALLSTGFTPTSAAPPPPPPNNPQRGLIYDGLERATTGPCRGMYRLKVTGTCTHGPDPAPVGVDVTQAWTPPAIPRDTTTTFTQCEGDGVSGYRTQVLYARASDKPDRYSTSVATLIQAAQDANSIYYTSALETGAPRQIRFVTDAGCNLTILNVTLSPTGDDTLDNTISQLRARGYTRTDRKYLVFMDANVYCGIGEIKGDDRATADNSNNSGPSFGRIDTRCWGGFGAAHEHMHTLGGVQKSAPHASGGWHCVDEYDVMCYSDSPSSPPLQYLCDSSHESRFDCNHDDYFHTNPPAGSYLATHWNAAQSRFLIGRLIVSDLGCEAMHTSFMCEGHVSGGTGGNTYTWSVPTSSRYDYADYSTMSASCSIGTSVSVTFSVRDSSGATASKTTSAHCSGGIP